MKYIIIDIETTGVNSTRDQILEIGAIIEDTSKKVPVNNLPQFKTIVYNNRFEGSAAALAMNQRIFKILSEYDSIKEEKVKIKFGTKHNILSDLMASFAFRDWIEKHFKKDEIINIAGKNFANFDKLFLERFASETCLPFIKHSRRYIDPAILFVDWKNDVELPNMDNCLKRAKIKRKVKHNALEDCIDVLLCLRNKY